MGEVASNPFCLLCNCSWLLVFALCLFFMILSGFNLYCWKGIHFSWSNSLIFLLLFLGLIFCFHFWFRDLLRELAKKYEVLLIVFFFVFLLFVVSEALLFVSFFWASFHSLFSFHYSLSYWLGHLLVCKSKNFGSWVYQLMIQFIVVSSFFLTGLHFFHLLVGLFLCCLFFWGCSFPVKNQYFLSLRVSEVHLFFNSQLFYWHFLEFLWLLIFLVFYKSFPSVLLSFFLCREKRRKNLSNLERR